MSQTSHDRASDPPLTLWIEGWRVDVSSHRMSRAGTSVRLEPRAVALLVYLAERPGQTVTREELEREVWRGRVVGYDALSRAITKLRKAFGDDPLQPRVIETIPKVGYRLVAEVKRVEPGPSSSEAAEPHPNLERKLTAILYADVAEYSRLTGEDEDGTHRALSSHLDLITATVARYNGQVVHFAGDAILADFAIASDALSCAVAIQHALEIRNRDLAENSKIQFRIGVNLGEVIVDRDDIYGDGVNVAARLESLAEPGGICISGALYDAVGHRLPVDCEFLGEQSVKNITKPVRAYHARLRPDALPPEPGAAPRRAERSRRPLVLAGGLAVVLIVTASGSIWFSRWNAREPVASTSSTPMLASDKPSVAVLPFANLSADPAQEFFADGLTGDLITDLSKVSGLFVIARHSVFAYKDQPKPVPEIAQELGVRFVVEGSIQRAAGRIRINAQLIDASNGVNLWAERYDRKEIDIFALQDRVIEDIVDTLAVKLTDVEKTRLARRRTASLEAYDYYLRAEQHRFHGDEGPAIEFYRQAIALDAAYSDAYAGIALSALELWRWDSTDVMPGAAARRMTYDAASKLLSLDENDPRAYAVLAMVQAIEGRHEEAIQAGLKSVSLDPNDADSHARLARIYMLAGEHAKAESVMKSAFKLNPRPPAYYEGELGIMAFFRHDYEQAQELFQNPDLDYHYGKWLAMAYAELGRIAEARGEMDKIYKPVPFANLAYYRTLFSQFKRKEDLELILGALKKAGVPEWPYGYQPVREHQLDEKSLAEITFGRTWFGHDSRGIPFVQQFTDDGRVVFRGRASLLTGTVRLKDELICIEFPGALLGREECGYVYRNPDSSSGQQIEYVRVALGDIYYFSVKPN